MQRDFTNSNPARCIKYTRCSTEEQEKQGHSHEYQNSGLDNCTRVRSGNYQIVAGFSDTTSGTSFDNRPGLDDAFRFCERNRGRVDLLFVYRWDRLGRDVADCFNAVKRFKSIGVEVNCPDQWTDFGDASFPVFLAMIFGMAQAESQKISERTRDGVHQALKEGYWAQTYPPRGYRRRETGGRTRSGKQEKICEPIPELVEPIRQCFEEYATGIIGKIELYKKYGKAVGLSKNAFCRIFQNPFYMGKILVPAYKREPAQMVDGKHEPIVPQRVWEKCQEVFAETENGMKGKTWNAEKSDIRVSEFFLKGVLADPITGKPMNAYRATGKKGVRYAYYGKQNSPGSQIVRAEVAHSIVQSAVGAFSISDESFTVLSAHLNSELSREFDGLKETASKVRKQIEKFRERSSRANDLLADGDISASDFRAMKSDYDSRIDALTIELLEIERKMSEGDDLEIRLLQSLRRMDTVFSASNGTHKNRMLRAFFPDGLEIDTEKQIVRTRNVNSYVLAMCSGSSIYERIEIKNGTEYASAPLSNLLGSGTVPTLNPKHRELLKLLLAA
jgi:site-specific DNA recombinase